MARSHLEVVDQLRDINGDVVEFVTVLGNLAPALSTRFECHAAEATFQSGHLRPKQPRTPSQPGDKQNRWVPRSGILVVEARSVDRSNWHGKSRSRLEGHYRGGC